MVAKCMTSTRHEIARVAAPIKVHTPFDLQISIPNSVYCFLSKGDKLQGAWRLLSWNSFRRGFGSFQRSRALALAFSGCSRSIDPLKGLRNKFYKPDNLWSPPAAKLPSTFNQFSESVLTDVVFRLYQLKEVQDARPFKHTNIMPGICTL